MKPGSKNQPMSSDEIQRLVIVEIQSAKDKRQTAKREKSWDRYYGRKLGNEKKGRSQFITRDVMDTVEWMMPFFMRTFASGDSKIDIKIKGQEPFVGKALMTQIQEDLADGTPTIFYLFYQWFKDALVSSTAFVKLGWNLDQKTVTVDFDDLSRQNFMQLLNDPDVQIAEVEEQPNPFETTFKVTAKVKQTIEDTVFAENTPHWEFLVSSRARDINDEHGKGQQTEVTLDYLKRINRARSTDKPYFKHLEEFEDAAKDHQSDSLSAEKTNYMEDDESSDEIDYTEKGMIEFKEWYTRLDVNGDGYLEDIVCFLGNNKLLRHEINEEGFIPFSAIRPIIDCYKFNGIAFAELIVEIQNLKTMLLRRILDSFDFQVSGRWRVDPDGSVDLHALYNHTPGGVISGKKGALEDISPQPFNPGNLTILEYVDALKENRTGLTRYNQGTDADSLNKMLDVNTPVPMYDGGYKAIGAVEKGDVIIGSDGGPTAVVVSHPVAMAQKAYDITFSSGDVITACGDHLWEVQNRWDREKLKKGQIVTTETIAQKGAHTKKGKPIWSIPRVLKPQTNGSVALPLDPYVFGVWLGDGQSYDPSFTTMDSYIVKRIKTWGAETGHVIKKSSHSNNDKAKTYSISCNETHIKNTSNGQFQSKPTGLRHMLSKMGVLSERKKHLKGTKHIPEIYFRASYSDRLELLRGLMDTDGCCHVEFSGAVFTQQKGQLATDVIRLIESLGGWPSVHLKKQKVKFIGKKRVKSTKPLVIIYFTLTDNPFALPRKADKHIVPKRFQKHQMIVDIKEVRPCFMRCLTVDNKDGLYCVGKRFTVTHNTARGIQAIQSAAMQRLELVARIFAEGLRDFYKKTAMLYQRYSKGFVANVFGQEKEITPEMLKGKVTCTVNMGIQAGVGIEETQKIERIVTFLMGINERYPGILTPEKVHNICTRYISSAGFKQIDDFIADLQSYIKEIKQSETQQQQMQEEMLQLQKQMQQMELQIKVKDADTKVQKVDSDAYLKNKELSQEAIIEQEKLAQDTKVEYAKIAQDEKESVREAKIDIAQMLSKPTEGV